MVDEYGKRNVAFHLKNQLGVSLVTEYVKPNAAFENVTHKTETSVLTSYEQCWKHNFNNQKTISLTNISHKCMFILHFPSRDQS